MKQIRKSFLTFLALTLFGGAGAWAQGPTTVFEVNFSSYATTGLMRIGNSSTIYPATIKIHDNSVTINTYKLASIYNYSDNNYLSIKPETGSFQTGDTLLIAMCYNNSSEKTAAADIYAANGTTLLFTTAPGINGRNESGDPVVEKFVLEQDADSLLIGRSSSSNTSATCVTTLKVLRPAGSQAIELTKSGANQWSLAQTPDYDLELQVEYYEPHALKNIPAGWQVMVNGVDKTAAIDGDSLMIVETDSVTLIPDNPRRVKSVTLEDEGPAVQTITVAGLQLNYVEGENWVQTAQRNPGVIEIDSYVNKTNGYFLMAGSSVVSPTSTYDSSLSDSYWWQEW